MKYRLGECVSRSTMPMRLAFLKFLAVGAVLVTSLASLPAHATIVSLNAFASGTFTSGIESGYELTALSHPVLNNNRSGTGNLENDSTVSPNTILSLRRQDGGLFMFQGFDLGNFGGPVDAMFVLALIGGVSQYSMVAATPSGAFGTVNSTQPLQAIDQIEFVLGSGGFDGTVEAIDNIRVASVNTGSVPEPASLALLALGLAGLGFGRRKKA